MASTAPVEDKKAFHPIDVPFPPFFDKELREAWLKWGLSEDMGAVKFSFDNALPTAAATTQISKDVLRPFVEDFFSDPTVRSALRGAFPMVFGSGRTVCEFDVMRTSKTRMSFLSEPLVNGGIVSESGHIKGRLEEDYEGIPIVNMLRECLLMEESEHWEVFSEQDRCEFLLMIFQHLVVGGAMNQYDDSATPYYDTTRRLYKEFCSVRRNEDGDIQVISKVVRVRSFSDEGSSLFPREHPSNFCYLIIDPLSRQLWVWYYGYRPWF
ncbi:unnamed protein product [Vitrella brassicaformis CCMP3155]|uniref:Cilia- and flagella-associated protein 300 n=1 Tax=Vitrella brassicaformis (strain CCMP3155) TaxID=1169540 RepID=A0A0G4EMG2_VITBC|nr:unnamed protein product [Vitrella brassicaformis CCMP3155]|eukprot:CEL98580.1 unnamed protein product [Vitrella brassicaformis CCMP3155]